MIENDLQIEDPHLVETFGDIEATLEERGKRYGEFLGHAIITQGIKDVMKDSSKWVELSPDKKEALEMVAHKIGRILNGDPEYADSWHDIIGYTKLVEDALPKPTNPLIETDDEIVERKQVPPGVVLLTAEERASTHAGSGPTLYVRFSDTFGLLEPHTLYRVTFIGHESFNVQIGASNKAIYFGNRRLRIPDEATSLLVKHASYY